MCNLNEKPRLAYRSLSLHHTMVVIWQRKWRQCSLMMGDEQHFNYLITLTHVLITALLYTWYYLLYKGTWRAHVQKRHMYSIHHTKRTKRSTLFRFGVSFLLIRILSSSTNLPSLLLPSIIFWLSWHDSFSYLSVITYTCICVWASGKKREMERKKEILMKLQIVFMALVKFMGRMKVNNDFLIKVYNTV